MVVQFFALDASLIGESGILLPIDGLHMLQRAEQHIAYARLGEQFLQLVRIAGGRIEFLRQPVVGAALSHNVEHFAEETLLIGENRSLRANFTVIFVVRLVRHREWAIFRCVRLANVDVC